MDITTPHIALPFSCVPMLRAKRVSSPLPYSIHYFLKTDSKRKSFIKSI